MELNKLKRLEELQKELKIVINPESNTKYFRSIKLLNKQLKHFKKMGEKDWRGFDINFVIKYTSETKFGKKEKIVTGDLF